MLVFWAFKNGITSNGMISHLIVSKGRLEAPRAKLNGFHFGKSSVAKVKAKTFFYQKMSLQKAAGNLFRITLRG